MTHSPLLNSKADLFMSDHTDSLFKAIFASGLDISVAVLLGERWFVVPGNS